MFWKPTSSSEDFLMHYAKGQRAKNHKYIKIDNGRYVYELDLNSKKSKFGLTKEVEDKAIAKRRAEREEGHTAGAAADSAFDEDVDRLIEQEKRQKKKKMRGEYNG